MARAKAVSVETIRQSVIDRALIPVSIFANPIKEKVYEHARQFQEESLGEIEEQKHTERKMVTVIESAKLDQDNLCETYWKDVFHKRMKKTIQRRNLDASGCRPGWHCINKLPKCNIKNCFIRDNKYANAKKVFAKSKNPSVEALLNSFNLGLLVDQILVSYEFLKSLDYSDRKITHLVKSYCKGDEELMSIFLKPTLSQEKCLNPAYYIHIINKQTLMNNMLLVASKNKLNCEVQQFYYNIKDYKERLEEDTVQRGQVIARMMGTSIVSNRQEVYKYFNMNLKEKRKSRYLDKIQRVEERYGQLIKITPINRNMHTMLSAEQTLLDLPEEPQF